MNINWKVRLKNPVWWVQVAVAAALPVLGYFGIAPRDISSWRVLLETIAAALSNPYVLGLAAVGLWNAVNDPTTAGLSDSARALSYTEPYKDEKEQ